LMRYSTSNRTYDKPCDTSKRGKHDLYTPP
jgi:hypothetical protein